MGGFFGKIIGTIVSRMLIMGAILGGGQYFLSQNGGISGLFGGGTSQPSVGQPIAAGVGGLGAIASSLGIGIGGAQENSNYFKVQGRISKIGVECRLTREQDGRMTRTEPLSCDRARTALSYPQFAEYSVSEARTATYIYYDMDGVNVLTGKTNARRTQKVGDVINLHVDRDNPGKSTPI